MSKLLQLECLILIASLIQFIADCIPVLPPCLYPTPEIREYILDESNRPENKYRHVALPTSLDWRWYNNNTYTSPIKNSLVQNYCGACWAFAATSSLTDRINIQNKHRFPEWSLSAQTLLDCSSDPPNNGCRGGNPSIAYDYIRKNGIATESCSPYRASGRDSNQNVCTESSKCMQCSAHNHCGAQYPYKAWKISEHATVKGESDMIAALQDGPIVCGMSNTQQFEVLNNFNVYKDNSNNQKPDLAVSIVGYGNTSDGQTYWIGRNSWGDYWGQNGYFRIVRGINNLGIESMCYWATPESKPYIVNGTNGNNTDNYKSNYKYLEYPTDFRWDNMNHTNYITAVRNQNVPNYCLSDWAFSVTSMMSDRLNIARAVLNNTSAWPEIIFSVQSLLNIPGGEISANCYGCGDLHTVMKYISANFVAVESCQLYVGNDEPPSPTHWCEYCNNPQNPKSCYPVYNFTSYTFSKWGAISGETSMKSSIYDYGPIVCGMDATPLFKQYTTGIYQQFLFTVSINHYVEIIGWGAIPNNGTMEPYWIGKNSWGTYWGESGLFRIQMKTDNLGIETDCYYGIPKLRN